MEACTQGQGKKQIQGIIVRIDLVPGSHLFWVCDKHVSHMLITQLTADRMC